MNHYPLWKNLLILATVLAGFILTLPNIFPQDPSIEITAARGGTVNEATVGEIKAALDEAKVPVQADRAASRRQAPGALRGERRSAPG